MVVLIQELDGLMRWAGRRGDESSVEAGISAEMYVNIRTYTYIYVHGIKDLLTEINDASNLEVVKLRY